MFNTNDVLSFYHLSMNPEHRYHSYDFCFDAFEKIISLPSPSDDDVDSMALHLGMYLASWGMYRGSTALLQKCSYKVHIGAIRILLNPMYRQLHKISPSQYCDDNITLLLNVFVELKNHYKHKGVSPTDTLITKILLGTLGCTMALDNQVKSSLGKPEFKITQKFGVKHLEDMKRYYDNNKFVIDAVVSEINNPRYHILKCMDMAFF